MRYIVVTFGNLKMMRVVAGVYLRKCRVNKWPLHSMKKHVLSVVHKNNHKFVTENNAMLDQEVKEMRKRAGSPHVSLHFLWFHTGLSHSILVLITG